MVIFVEYTRMVVLILTRIVQNSDQYNTVVLKRLLKGQQRLSLRTTRVQFFEPKMTREFLLRMALWMSQKPAFHCRTSNK